MENYIIHRDTELYHFGVKGQKWGIRRYQNTDGSYKSGAEGRYYNTEGSKISGPKKNVSTNGGGTSVKISRGTQAARDLHASRGSVVEEGKKKTKSAETVSEKTSGGGDGAAEEKKTEETSNPNATAPYEKTLSDGTKITVYPTSMKKAQTGKGEKGQKASTFKVNDLYDKIDGIDLDSIGEAEQKQLDNLIVQYQAYKATNSTSNKKTKAIDQFIAEYEHWKSTGEKKKKEDESEKKEEKMDENKEEYEEVEYYDGKEKKTKKTKVLKHHGILGMHWGIRRYQNPDGSYTEAGKRRYQKDVQSNHQKSKKNRVNDADLKDPNRWVREDLTNAKQVADSSKTVINELKNLEQNTRPKDENQRLDLSKMTDKELRDRINRELLEQQYNNMFNKKDVSKGRENVQEALSIGGNVVGIASGIIGIALAIHQMRK